MTELSKIGTGKVWTQKTILRQDIPNSITDFTNTAPYQDFMLFGIPANHMILGVKVTVLVNFDAANSNTAMLYVGNSSVFPANPTSTFVTNVHDCYGVGNLTIPSGSDATYEYGSFRWFTVSTPGSTNTISPAYCLPKRMDAHDIIARVVVTGGNNVSQMLAGMVDITVQYGAI